MADRIEAVPIFVKERRDIQNFDVLEGTTDTLHYYFALNDGKMPARLMMKGYRYATEDDAQLLSVLDVPRGPDGKIIWGDTVLMVCDRQIWENRQEGKRQQSQMMIAEMTRDKFNKEAKKGKVEVVVNKRPRGVGDDDDGS